MRIDTGVGEYLCNVEQKREGTKRSKRSPIEHGLCLDEDGMAEQGLGG